MTEHRVFTVDAFTHHAYGGNPCAVVLDADDLSSDQMQTMAQEMNLSETAFVLSSERAAFRVRYFTPREEIPFAGHPTIATTYAMAMEGGMPVHPPGIVIEIEFAIGVLPVEIEVGDSGIERIVMTQPAPMYGRAVDSGAVAGALHLLPGDLQPACSPRVAGVGVPFLMIGLRNRETMLDVSPDWSALQDICRSVDASAAYLLSLIHI